MENAIHVSRIRASLGFFFNQLLVFSLGYEFILRRSYGTGSDAQSACHRMSRSQGGHRLTKHERTALSVHPDRGISFRYGQRECRFELTLKRGGVLSGASYLLVRSNLSLFRGKTWQRMHTWASSSRNHCRDICHVSLTHPIVAL